MFSFLVRLLAVFFYYFQRMSGLDLMETIKRIQITLQAHVVKLEMINATNRQDERDEKAFFFNIFI